LACFNLVFSRRLRSTEPHPRRERLGLKPGRGDFGTRLQWWSRSDENSPQIVLSPLGNSSVGNSSRAARHDENSSEKVPSSLGNSSALCWGCGGEDYGQRDPPAVRGRSCAVTIQAYQAMNSKSSTQVRVGPTSSRPTRMPTSRTMTSASMEAEMVASSTPASLIVSPKSPVAVTVASIV